MDKKDERILKKVGKLLSLYGVTDEEKEKFLLDLEDKKYDDQEEVEEVSETEETPTEEVEETEEVVDETPTEEPVEEPVEETEEEQPVEEPVEQPTEETPTEEEPTESLPVAQDHEEVQKTIDGLVARIESLEDLVKKLGVKVEDDSFGERPNNQSAESYQENEFDRYNKLRRGN
ncbi:MAG: hypothetical protein PUK09_05970 [Bacilli bacterium]|nr:hypothetical protein [Bacilli bacterium]